MTFGQTIKELRLKANMTQEQLAEILSISGQAVSRWENDIAMPDISAIPTLANLFDVSCDYLLGVDTSKKEEKIDRIIKQADQCGPGHSEESANIIREGLKECPRSYRLMYYLLLYLDLYTNECNAEKLPNILKESIYYGEKIQNGCTEENIRFGAIHYLCQSYTQMGEIDKAKKLANSLPDIGLNLNRQTMLSRISHGTEQFDAKKEALASLLTQAIIGFNNLNTKLDNGQWALSIDEEITMHENAITLTQMLCPDDNSGPLLLSLVQAYKSNSFLYFEKGDIVKGVSYLQKAVETILTFEKTNWEETQTYTSLLLQGKPYGKIYFTGTHTLSSGLLLALEEQTFYENIKDNKEVQKIIDMLYKHSNVQ